jgi:hypothetical protein
MWFRNAPVSATGWRWNSDRIVSLTALIVVVFSLFTVVYPTHITRQRRPPQDLGARPDLLALATTVWRPLSTISKLCASMIASNRDSILVLP